MDTRIPQTMGMNLASVVPIRKYGRPRKYQTEGEIYEAKEIRRIKNTEAVRQRWQRERQVQEQQNRAGIANQPSNSALSPIPDHPFLQFTPPFSGISNIQTIPNLFGLESIISFISVYKLISFSIYTNNIIIEQPIATSSHRPCLPACSISTAGGLGFITSRIGIYKF